ncbi:spindle pole body formation-associated domain-containing protein [Trichoderma evansii]
MLGWMLGRGENAPDAMDTGDNATIEMPDTPAPVFAARAFKSALFGTPVRDAQRASRDKARAAKSTAFTTDQGSDTPLRPQGILLTPGTGASRPKRVSFNHDLATTKTISPNNEGVAVNKRTRLSDVLDKARRKSTTNVSKQTETFTTKDESDGSDWEEELYDENGDFGGQDLTVDLNEPHSQSGKYWKEQFEKYHEEARAEMEKLLKYKKHLKSYAEEKDLEAIHLTQRLKEEQEKVVAMEKKISENANYMVSKQRGASSSNETTELLATLTKQTALAAQYRHRAQELEVQLEELHKGREEDEEEAREWRRLQGTTSPNTAKTILETQRELRRSRVQLKEMDALRSQVSSLKAQLKTAEQRRITDYSTTDESNDTAKVRDLKAQLRQAREESLIKDDELRLLKKDFDVFKNESEAHDADTKAVLERAQTKISELKKELKSLKAGESANTVPPVATNGVRRSIDVADLERPRQLPETNSSKLRTLRDKYRRDATPRAATKPRDAVEAPSDQSNDEKPGWLSYVPRSSTKRRASVSREAPKRNQASSEVPASSGDENIGFLKVPKLPRPTIHPKISSSSDDLDVEVDLLQDHFARLGGPNAGKGKLKDIPNDSNSKLSLPSERRAAALARIEKRMAEKRARQRNGIDKENLQMAPPLHASEDEIQNEIALLESRLNEAKARLSALGSSSAPSIPYSALPIGSFAFSSGLESFAAHNRRASSFSTFLPLSLSSFASTTLPFVLAAYRDPASLADLDDELDAAVICTVGRRASVAQGRALLSIWERSFKTTLSSISDADALILKDFSTLLRRESNKAGSEAPLVSAHLGPLFGAICAIVGLTLRQTAYVFMLSHVKALISAAVRANMFGPYQAQKLLASENVQAMITAMVEREWHTPVEQAGQSVPVVDLWVGRHELLYSRIFNS